MLEKHPKLKQIYASLWALGNNDTGLIWDIEPIKIAHQRDVMATHKTISFVESSLVRNKTGYKRIREKGR